MKKIVYITGRTTSRDLCQPISMYEGEFVIHLANYTTVTEEPVQPGPGEQCFALFVEEDEIHNDGGTLRLWNGTRVARKDPKEKVRCIVASIRSMDRFDSAPKPGPVVPEEIDTPLLREIMRRATDEALIAIPYVAEGNLDAVKAWINGETETEGQESPNVDHE